LHGALFDLAFFGDEAGEGLNQGIGIAEGVGDGGLLGLSVGGNATLKVYLCAVIGT
jgi:hypothetical protein